MTLESVAEATKISLFLLSSLERGDVSRWPGGIYRRSFIRAYAGAIGLPPEPTLRDFMRLFPEPGQNPSLFDDDPRRLRLTLVMESRWKARARRGLAAAADIAAVFGIGYGLTALSNGALWTLTAVAGVVYHATSTALLGESPATWAARSGIFGRSTPSSTFAEVALLRQDWLGLLEPAEGNTEGQAVT